MSLFRNLKRNYVVDNADGSFLTYPKEKFGVLINFEDNSYQKEITVRSALVNIETKKDVLNFPRAKYTEKGEQGPVKNKGKVETYNEAVKVLGAALQTLKADLADKIETRDEIPKLKDGDPNPAYLTADEAVTEAQKLYREKELEWSEFTSKPVLPKRDVVNKYADLKAIYDPTVENPLGADWLSAFKPGGVKLLDEIEPLAGASKAAIAKSAKPPKAKK